MRELQRLAIVLALAEKVVSELLRQRFNGRQKPVLAIPFQ
jgi:hypothetical protein